MTDFAALVAPTKTLANVRLGGATETGAMPLPVRATDCGLFEALSVTVSVAVRLPKAEGVSVTGMVQLFPAASVAGLIGQVPPQAKSPGAVPPEIEMPLIVTGTFSVFLNVAFLAALASPTGKFPKESVAGAKVAWANTDGEGMRKESKSTIPQK